MVADSLDNPVSDLYTMADILACCAGMRREHVYYLEQRGYVQPLKQRHGRLERNLFTRRQAELLAAFWKYRCSGMSARRACESALKESTLGQLSLWEETAS
jgi:hypothetical protein